MAHYYSDSDTEDSCGSYDEGSGEEYTNVDFGVFSPVSFGLPSVYERGGGRRGEEEEDEEDDLYEPIEGASDMYCHRFFAKVWFSFSIYVVCECYVHIIAIGRRLGVYT